MSKRRVIVVVVVWMVTAATVTGWVLAQTGGEVTAGDALLVGAVVASLLSALVARTRRK